MPIRDECFRLLALLKAKFTIEMFETAVPKTIRASLPQTWQVPRLDPAQSVLPTKFSLAVLRDKEIASVKELKFLKKSQPKFVFADCEIQVNLDKRSPDKEKLLFLHSENKRYQEKCFFGDIDSKKCNFMSEFYSNHKDILNDITVSLTSFSTNVELERYLKEIKDNLTKDFNSALETLQKHHQSLVKKYNEVQRLTSEMFKAKEKSMTKMLNLKENFYKGKTLTEDEIVQLSLHKCQETNSKLTSAFQLHGKQLDELREKFLWQRDGLVTELALAHEKAFAPEKILTDEESDEKSNPASLVGSRYEILVEHDHLAGAIAKISKNTEELTKYYYKLADLKRRFEECLLKRGNSIVSERSAPTLVSNMHVSTAYCRLHH